MTAKEMAKQAKAAEAWKQHIHDVRRKAGLAAARSAGGGAARTKLMRNKQVENALEQYAPHLVAEYQAAYAAAENK